MKKHGLSDCAVATEFAFNRYQLNNWSYFADTRLLTGHYVFFSSLYQVTAYVTSTHPQQVSGHVSFAVVDPRPPPFPFVVVAFPQHNDPVAVVKRQFVLVVRLVCKYCVHHAVVHYAQLLLNAYGSGTGGKINKIHTCIWVSRHKMC